MQNRLMLGKVKPYNRRQFLKLGLAGVGVTGAAVAFQNFKPQIVPPVRVPPLSPSNGETASTNGTNPMAVLRDFDYGTVKRENGRTIREFRIVAGNSTIQLNKAVAFNSWNFNGRLPGPTLRAK